jgi:anaerobic selenocysteine-containing dehydrogenase
MIERQWFDAEFIREWSNGPHLVRVDNGRLLNGSDLAPDGDERHLFGWDEIASALVRYDPAQGRYDVEASRLALKGEYRIATARGEVLCHPAFELYRRLCSRYRPETVEAICWIPAAQVEQAAHMIWHARPVSYYAWSGHEQHANVTQTARAMSLLYALWARLTSVAGTCCSRYRPQRRSTGPNW